MGFNFFFFQNKYINYGITKYFARALWKEYVEKANYNAVNFRVCLSLRF
jgi:hypothetical protein